MKSFLDEFFYTHKQKRVRESVMLARISVSVFLIVACLAAISFTAYAYFTCTVSSSIMELQSANFHADITVTAAPNTPPIPLTPTGDGRFQVFLNNNVEYSVTLTRNGTAETGFCVITSDISNKVYCTQQFGIDRTAPDGLRTSITFTLEVETPTIVTFFPHWGTSACYDEYTGTKNDDPYILDKETVRITADRISVTDSIQSGETTVPPTQQVTTPPTTSPAPTTQPTEALPETTPPQTEITLPPTTTPTVPETLPLETLTTEPTTTEPEETESGETEPSQSDSTESTQPEEITTPTAVPDSTNPTENN